MKIVTHSELSSIKNCPKYWHYAYEKGLRSPYTTDAAVVGSGIHTILEHHYKGTDWYETTTELQKNLHELYLGDQPKIQTAHRKILDIYYYYLEFCGLDRFHADPTWHNDFRVAYHNGKPLVEVEFLVPIFTPSGRKSRLFQLAGRVDLVAEDQYGNLWIVDHKTKVTVPVSMPNMVIDQQPRAYAFAMSVFLGRPIKGAIYNVIRRDTPNEPKINKNGELSIAKISTTQDKFIEAFERQDDYLRSLSESERSAKKLKPCLDFNKYEDLVANLRDNRYLGRFYQEYTKDDMKQAQLELYQAAMLTHYMEYPYKNDRACDSFGGCEFKPLCHGYGDESMYTVSGKRHNELNVEQKFGVAEGVEISNSSSGKGDDGKTVSGYNIKRFQGKQGNVSFHEMLEDIQ
jgi:hypothetical protein